MNTHPQQPSPNDDASPSSASASDDANSSTIAPSPRAPVPEQRGQELLLFPHDDDDIPPQSQSTPKAPTPPTRSTPGRKKKTVAAATTNIPKPSEIRTDANTTKGVEIDKDPIQVEQIRARLAAWYALEKRDLPWRGQHDPYKVLVSEMMLVQTTVAAAIPFYHRFLERFPTLLALANAEEAEVLKAWEGLGYYRRAKQLHAAARTVRDEHMGVFPQTLEAVNALPGVGRYIAGAILSFAFNRPAPIVEANTQRVLARWLAREDDIKTTASQKRLWEAAERFVPHEHPGEFNQAFMELGALICRPADPSCLICPVSGQCQAKALGLQNVIPTSAPRAAPKDGAESCVILKHPQTSAILLFQRGGTGLWSDFWEFPTLHRDGANPAARPTVPPAETGFGSESETTLTKFAQAVETLTGASARVSDATHEVRYTVTNHRMRLTVHQALWTGASPNATTVADAPRPPAGFADAVWAPQDSLRTYTLSAAGRRVLDWLFSPSEEKSGKSQRRE